MPEPGDPWSGVGQRRHEDERTPVVAQGGPRIADTSYLCVVDAAGNAFSATPSDRLDWSPVIPELGLVASPRGLQSRLDPDHPSAIGPGRRPRLTPQPALAQRSDGSVLAFGTPGGDVQAQAMLQMLVNTVVLGASLQAAIETPRFASLSHPNSFYPHAYEPGLLRLEGRYPEVVAAELTSRGHHVSRWADWDPEAGAVCAALLEASGGSARLSAGADPRRMAYAGGW
jgi:gamma-glutamyltranspeptidase/glutathione hydrolase